MKKLVSFSLALVLFLFQTAFASGTIGSERTDKSGDRLYRLTSETLAPPTSPPVETPFSAPASQTLPPNSVPIEAKPAAKSPTKANALKKSAKTQKVSKPNVFQVLKAVKTVKKMQKAQNLQKHSTAKAPKADNKLLIAWVLLTVIFPVGVFAIHRLIVGTDIMNVLWYFLLCCVAVGFLLILIDWVFMLIDLIQGTDQFSGVEKLIAWLK